MGPACWQSDKETVDQGRAILLMEEKVRCHLSNENRVMQGYISALR